MRAEAGNDRDGWWAVRAVMQAVRPTYPEPLLAGEIGEIACSCCSPLTLLEWTTLVQPGLAGLGWEAMLRPLSEVPLGEGKARRGSPIAILTFEGPCVEETPAHQQARELAGHEGRPAPPDLPVPRLVAQELITAPSTGQEVFPFSPYWLSLQRSLPTLTRRVRLQKALLRWLAYATALPERALSASSEDAAVRAKAVTFLEEIAGQQRTPFAVRLRRAAEALEATPPNLIAVYAHLGEALFRDLHLPTTTQQALLCPPALALTPLERQDLLYLARAGNSELRTLAVARLMAEREYPEVQSLLHQLGYDSHPWVRALSRPFL